eukprot:TRINITY_DN884_c0_g1_i3.p1 TRINITY_DN884_c0_g1~~TRINITY_DN884_c0_g1_i3.p1  ORF type:complete len:460 (+),score=98.75 TRINITY_DN884_c0_g1_i3:341-1720(+)
MQGCSPCAPLLKGFTFKQNMSSSTNGVSTFRHSSLNPNAAEFVPSALRTISANTQNVDVSKPEASDPCGKAVLKRSESSTSSASDDESKQYWRYRLPDDIIPDFGEDVLHDTDRNFSGTLKCPEHSSELTKSVSLVQAFEKLSTGIDVTNSGKSRLPFSQSVQGETSVGLSTVPFSNGWENFIENDHQIVKSREGYLSNEECSVGYLNEYVGEQALSDNGDLNPVEYLATKFPDYASESLASIYYATGGDLILTTEILTKLELQDGAASQQSFTSRASSAPNLSSMDFPALPNADTLHTITRYTGDELEGINTYRRGEGSNLLFSGAPISSSSGFNADFAAVVRKSISDSGQWKNEKSGDQNFGSGRNPQVSSGSSTSNSRMINGDRLRSYTSTRQNPTLWLETGDSVASMYSTMREEARDHARIRNAYFEQVFSCIVSCYIPCLMSFFFHVLLLEASR